MKIPFQDSRREMNRRWTDYEKIRERRFIDIFNLIESCNEFMEPEYLKLLELLEDKLNTIKNSGPAW